MLVRKALIPFVTLLLMMMLEGCTLFISNGSKETTAQTAPPNGNGQVVVFQDIALEHIVRQAIDKDEGTLRTADLAELTVLQAAGANLTRP
jgi:hypothetical protein